MSISEITEYDSESCDSVEDDDDEVTGEILRFCDKITDDLKLRFRKNLGSEDYCDDIYENKFTTSASGSYSYYADILAVAQMNVKNVCPGYKEVPDVQRSHSEIKTV